MKKIIYVVALMALNVRAYSQFNTIKAVKKLPRIEIDTVYNNPNQESQAQTLDPSVIKLIEKQTGALVSMPLSHPIINSNFGHRIDPLTGKEKFHYGIDFKGASDSVMVIMPGEVKKVAYSRGFGNYIEVEHGDFKTTYGHLSFVMVREKMKLNAGQVIGITGNTGRSTGDHLHFAIKHKGRNINPIPFLDLIYRSMELNAKRQ